jgi:hypothetical protein
MAKIRILTKLETINELVFLIDQFEYISNKIRKSLKDCKTIESKVEKLNALTQSDFEIFNLTEMLNQVISTI